MSRQIRVEVKSGIWRGAGEEAVVRRIAEIVAGHANAEQCQQQKDGYKWGLCVSGNDWFATEMTTEPNPEGGRDMGVITVAYRYGGGGNEQMMEALQTYLNWVFN